MIASTTVLFVLFFLPSLSKSKSVLQASMAKSSKKILQFPLLATPSNLTDAIGDDADAELLEPPEDDVTITLEQPPEEARPIPTLVDSRPRLSSDALPPKPSSAGNGNTGGSLSYSAQVAEQFSSAYRQTPSQERGRLDAARLAQFQVNQNQNQNAGAPSVPGAPLQRARRGRFDRRK
jgi:hypothetical protein